MGQPMQYIDQGNDGDALLLNSSGKVVQNMIIHNIDKTKSENHKKHSKNQHSLIQTASPKCVPSLKEKGKQVLEMDSQAVFTEGSPGMKPILGSNLNHIHQRVSPKKCEFPSDQVS